VVLKEEDEEEELVLQEHKDAQGDAKKGDKDEALSREVSYIGRDGLSNLDVYGPGSLMRPRTMRMPLFFNRKPSTYPKLTWAVVIAHVSSLPGTNPKKTTL